MDGEKILTQFSVTSSDNSGLRMKIAIPRAETHAGLSTRPVAKRRGRPKKKAPDSSSDSNSSSDSSDEDTMKLSGSGQRGRKSTSLKTQRASSVVSATSSDSDFDAFSGNAKRSSGRPKIRPVAVSTPDVTKRAAAKPTIDVSTTPVKRRPGRPPKKLPVSVPGSGPCIPSSQPSRVKEPRLSLVDGGSSTDNDATMAINAAINRVFESGGSDSELNGGQVGPIGPPGRQGKSSGASNRTPNASSATKAAVLSPIQYTSNLLREFVEKTQKLGQQQEVNVIVPDQTANSLPRESSATNCEPNRGKVSDSNVLAAAVTGDGTAEGAVRKKRGRPPKKPPVPEALPQNAPVKTDRLTHRVKLTMRDSPDSGILSVNQSPSHSPLGKKAPTNSSSAAVPSSRSLSASAAASSSSNAAMLLSLEKPMYTTERVLYPPRAIKRGRPPANKPKEDRRVESNRLEKTGVDPMWRKIDINKKFQRLTNGYKSDGGTSVAVGGDRGVGTASVLNDAGYRGEGSSVVCSKVLAAQCGYASDYGSVRKSRQSGYRSDYSTKSRKSGYRSDFSVKGGGCGYRSDCSIRRKLRRKRRPKTSASTGADAKNLDAVPDCLSSAAHRPDSYLGMRTKASTFDEQDILQLAGLSLGNSSDEDSGNEVTVVAPQASSDVQATKRGGTKDWLSTLRRPIVKFASTPKLFDGFDRAKFEREFIMNYRALVAQSRAEAEAMEARINPPEEAKVKQRGAEKKPDIPKYNCFENFSNVLPIIELKSKRSAKSIRSRRSSAVSRCSSRSNRSMHHKHRRKRLKSTKSESGTINKLAERIRLQLEQIIEMFDRACQLAELPVALPASTSVKAPKVQVQIPETVATAAAATTPTTGKGEKEKEKATATQKRGVKKRKLSDNVEHVGTPSGPKRRTKKGQDSQSPDDHKLPLKKRHYLLTDGGKGTVSGEREVSVMAKETPPEVNAPSTPKGRPVGELKIIVSTPSASSPSGMAVTPRSRKASEVQSQQQQPPPQEKKRKLLSPPTPVSARGRPPKNATVDKKLSPVPPPGVFEPTMDLELQIPISTIVISGTGKGGVLSVRSKVASKPLDSPTPSLVKKKRKKINRTGFPTAKKKKKKRHTPVPSSFVGLGADILPDLKLEKCDRVPTDGEAMSKFLERNDLKQRLAVVSLERLQEPGLLSPRTLRGKDSPKTSRDVSKEPPAPTPSVAPATVAQPRSTRKVKAGEPKPDDIPPPPPKLKRRSTIKVEPSPPPPVTASVPKSRSRRATSVERSEDIAKSERRISLLEEISPHKRQSIRNLAKTLMVSETTEPPRKETPTPAVVAKKIDPRKRRMTVAVLEAPKTLRNVPKTPTAKLSATKVAPQLVQPPPPMREESPTALKDIKPAPLTTEMEQDILPMDEDQDDLETVRTDTPCSEISDRSHSKRTAPRWKKKYLPAGLFSEYYKEADKERSTTKSTPGQSATKDSSDVAPASGPVLLPPPPYCEKFFRRTVIDFQLPHDLWWAHDNQKLPGRDTVASWNFKKIRTNVYSDVKPNPNTDLPSCNCKPSSGCVDDCLNRMVYTECNPDTCPCEDKCQNTKIQRHEFAPGIERFMTEKKGWGVRTKNAIRKSQFIIEYLGEVVTEREFKERMGTVYAKDTHHYCLHLDGDLVIDGHRMGSDCRFVNHSCTPNCEVQKWSVNGLSRMCLFALRDIQPGEELTYDYNFALYNPSEGQPCKCDSADCRGVIGGKSQRVAKPAPDAGTAVGEDVKSATAARNRKRQAKKNNSQAANKVRPTTPLFQAPTGKEIGIIRESHCFLMRNLMKVRRQKDVMPFMDSVQDVSTANSTLSGAASRRTRAIKGPEEIDESVIQLRLVLMRICEELIETRTDPSDPLLNMPPKKKNPKYFEKFERPIDLTTIHDNADRWSYKTVRAFDEDVMRMLKHAAVYYAAGSAELRAAEELQKLYEAKKYAEHKTLSLVITDKGALKEFEPPEINELELKLEPNEDIIRCICGLFKDEGLMIECAKCQVWQHAECTRADTEVENYMCERCEPRDVNLEITLEDEFSDEGYQYYLSLLRGSLQIRQTDTVYVLRDIPMTPDKGDPEKKVRKHTYETIGSINYADCDIFRVERLWKDNEGKRFVFGHHYLRPHETYHEPTRKFYPNEVVRVPLYEVVPIELIMDRCWVLDPTTYCKGRPVDSVEEHVYICELRVDKSARLFSKVSKQANPVCKKSYAFKKFKQKLKISKSYAPHDHAPVGGGGSSSSTAITQPDVASLSSTGAAARPAKKRRQDVPIASRKNSTSIVQLRPPPPKTLQEKRQRLEATLTRLMSVQRAINPIALMDLSYLLTGRGARAKSSRAMAVTTIT